MLPQHLEKFQPQILVLEMGADSLANQKNHCLVSFLTGTGIFWKCSPKIDLKKEMQIKWVSIKWLEQINYASFVSI